MAGAYTEPADVKTISQLSVAYGLDPAAVLAVASQEGLSGGVGDQGTSFGPFQLHIGGAYSTAENDPASGAPKISPSPSAAEQSAAEAWANSTSGLTWAISRISNVARGQQGGAAISSIVTGFERPVDPGSEIGSAQASYPAWQSYLQDPSRGPYPAEQATSPDAATQRTQLLAECDHSGASFGGCFCGIPSSVSTHWYEPWTYIESGVKTTGNFFTTAIPCLASWAYGWLQRLGLLLAAAALALLGLYLVARDAGAAPGLASGPGTA